MLEVTVKVWGIRGVSPEEEKVGYVGKDLQKYDMIRYDMLF